MNRALWWKAWREQRTASLACLAWMLLCATYVLFYEWQHPIRAPIARLYSSALLFQWFAGTCLAILVSQRERWEKSLRFTRALPVPLGQTATARIGVAAISLALPVIVAALIIAIPLACGWIEQARERALYRDQPQLLGWGLLERPAMPPSEAFEFLARAMAISLASGLQFVLLLAIAGNFVRSEKTVGFLGVVLSLICLVIGGEARTAEVNSIVVGGLMPSSMVIGWSYSDVTGHYDDLDVMSQAWPALTLNLLVLAGLLWLFLKTYGRHDAALAPKYRWRFPSPTQWLRGRIPQFHSTLGSLVWLTLRQSLPLAVSGLVVAVLIAMTEVQVLGQSPDLPVRQLALNLGGTTWFIGIAWSVVVAAGVFGGELQPKLARFWSSRPIVPGQWLLVKYVTGLLAVLCVLDGTAILSGFTARLASPELLQGEYGEMSWSYIAIIPLDHALVYSLAVAMVIATRSGVLGAGVALGAFTIMQTVIEFVPQWFYRDAIGVYNDLRAAEIKGTFDLTQHGYPGMIIWSLTLIAVCYLLARRRLIRGLRDA